MKYTPLTFIGLGSLMEPFYDEFLVWRDQVPEHLQAFTGGVLIKDDGSISTTILLPAPIRLPPFIQELKPGVWEQNFARFLECEDEIREVYGQILTEVSLAQNIRNVANKGDSIKRAVRSILLSSMFDPVGSSLVTMTAYYTQKTNSEKTDLPLHNHLMALAPDLFTSSTQNRPLDYKLDQGQQSWAKIRTARYFKEVQEAYLNVTYHHMSSLPKLFDAVWIFSSTDEQGTVLNDFKILGTHMHNAYALWFSDTLDDRRENMPAPSGDPSIVNALGVFELHYQRKAMREALAGRVTHISLQQDLSKWEKWSRHRQKLNAKIAQFIRKNDFDKTSTRLGVDESGASLDVPFRQKIVERIDTYRDIILAAWREHTKKTDVLGKITHRMEQILAEDKAMILAEIRMRLDTPEHEIPSAIAYLSMWLDKDCSHIKGAALDKVSGFQEIWSELTTFFDELIGATEARAKMKKAHQDIKDKTILSHDLKERLENALADDHSPRQKRAEPPDELEIPDSAHSDSADSEQPPTAEPKPDDATDDETDTEVKQPESTEHESDDRDSPTQKEDPSIKLEGNKESDILHGRMALLQNNLDKLEVTEAELAKELVKVNQAMEDPGARRELFENKVEKEGLEEFEKINDRLMGTAKEHQFARNEVFRWEEKVKKGRIRFVIYFILILLLVGGIPLSLGAFTELISFTTGMEWALRLTITVSLLHMIINGYRQLWKPLKKLTEARQTLERIEKKQVKLQEDGISRLTRLERDRTRFATCSLAIEWFYRLKQAMKEWYDQILKAKSELENLNREALNKWDQYQTRNDEKVLQFPGKEVLGEIWNQKEKIIDSDLKNYYKNPGNERSRIIDTLDAKEYAQHLHYQFNAISHKQFEEYYRKDAEEMLMDLSKTTSFDTERLLENNVRNTIALANLKDLYSEQNVSKTFLIVSNNTKEKSEFLRLVRKIDPAANRIPIMDKDKIILYRVLEGYALSNWGFAKQARAELGAFPKKETDVACEPEREFRQAPTQRTFASYEDKKNFQLLIKLWSAGKIEVNGKRQFLLEKDGRYLEMSGALQFLSKAKSHGILKRLYRLLEEVEEKPGEYHTKVDQFINDQEEHLDKDELTVLGNFADRLNPLG